MKPGTVIWWRLKLQVAYLLDRLFDRCRRQLDTTSTFDRRFGGQTRRIKARKGRCYNGSVAQIGGQTVFCYRYERYLLDYHLHRHVLKQKTFIKACFLDADFRQQGRVHTLKIPGHLAEDPRLFVFRGEPWVLYNDEPRAGERKLFLCRLVIAEGIDCDEASRRELRTEFAVGEMEKNWVPFVLDDELFVSYEINPHIVLRVDPDTGLCAQVAASHQPRLRRHRLSGGTPAISHEGRFAGVLHYFDQVQHKYRMKIYSFEAQPPFRLISVSGAILSDYSDSIFPVGIFASNGKVWVSCGRDRVDCVILEFSNERFRCALGTGSSTSDLLDLERVPIIEALRMGRPTADHKVDPVLLQSYEGRYSWDEKASVRIECRDSRLYCHLDEGLGGSSERPLALGAISNCGFIAVKGPDDGTILVKSPVLVFQKSSGKPLGFRTFMNGKGAYFKRMDQPPDHPPGKL